MQGVRIDEVDAASETRADIENEDQAQVQAKVLDSSDVVDTDYDEGLNTNSIFFCFLFVTSKTTFNNDQPRSGEEKNL